MSNILDSGGNELVKPQQDRTLNDFDHRVYESLAKVLWLPSEFKTYMAEFAALLGLPVPLSQIQGYQNTPPKLIDVIVFMTPVTHTNWSTISTAGANAAFAARMQSSGAQNDSITFNVALTPGTWEVSLLHERDPDNGIYSVRFDGVEKGTIDGYAAAQTVNVISMVSGIDVPVAKQVALSLVMATKNASSSSYFGRIQHLQLRKTD